jgi:hypothetical protein
VSRTPLRIKSGARNYKKSGYTLHFSISVTGGHTYFSDFSATLSKGHVVIHEAIGEPLSKSSEVVH